MTTSQEDPLERFYCGEFDFERNWSVSSHMHDERHLAFTDGNKFCLLDVLRMETKSFEVDLEVIPKSPERKRLDLNHVHWVSVNKAFVFIEEGLTDGTKNHYIAQMEIDHKNSLCAVRKFHQFDDQGRISCIKFVRTTGGRVGVSFCGWENMVTETYYEILDLQTNPWELKKIRKLPDNFYAKAELDGYLYDFSPSTISGTMSNLIKVCLETGEKTTVELEGFPLSSTGRLTIFTNKSVWIGRRLIVAVYNWSGHGPCYYHRLLVLDVDLLEWRQLEWNCKDEIEALSSDGDNILVVTSYPTDSSKPRNVHRFALNRPDKLSTICWIATKNHAKRVPAFESHVLNGQPKNSPFRRVFGVLPPTKRSPSESPQPSCSGLQTAKRSRVDENEK